MEKDWNHYTLLRSDKHFSVGSAGLLYNMYMCTHMCPDHSIILARCTSKMSWLDLHLSTRFDVLTADASVNASKLSSHFGYGKAWSVWTGATTGLRTLHGESYCTSLLKRMFACFDWLDISHQHVTVPWLVAPAHLVNVLTCSRRISALTFPDLR